MQNYTTEDFLQKVNKHTIINRAVSLILIMIKYINVTCFQFSLYKHTIIYDYL